MAERRIEFEVYRLNVVDDEDMLPIMGRRILTDREILSVVEYATSADLDYTSERDQASSTYKWGLREFVEFDNEGLSTAPIAGVAYSRAILRQTGTILKDTGLEQGISTPDQPLALTVQMILYMERHLVAVERRGKIMDTQVWRSSLHTILDKAATALGFKSSIRLEAVSHESEILSTFQRFTLLMHLKLHLRLPNPDLSRYMKSLFDMMTEGQVRDLSQDMRNNNGLSQEKGALPHAAVTMANAGYRKGEVLMEGIIDDEFQSVTTGQSAVRVSVDATKGFEELREYTRGAAAAAQAKSTKSALESVIAEINKKIEAEQAG